MFSNDAKLTLCILLSLATTACAPRRKGADVRPTQLDQPSENQNPDGGPPPSVPDTTPASPSANTGGHSDPVSAPSEPVTPSDPEPAPNPAPETTPKPPPKIEPKPDEKPKEAPDGLDDDPEEQDVTWNGKEDRVPNDWQMLNLPLRFVIMDDKKAIEDSRRFQ